MMASPASRAPESGRRLDRLRRRFRWAAIILMVPLGLLVGRAIWGVEAEYRAYHETVARRLFDEIERALTEILRAEERRPVAAYAIGADAIERPPYVVGHFEMDDRLRTLQPDAAEAVALAVRDIERGTRGGGVDWMAPGSTVAHNNLPNVGGKLSLSSLNRGASRSGRFDGDAAARNLGNAFDAPAPGNAGDRGNVGGDDPPAALGALANLFGEGDRDADPERPVQAPVPAGRFAGLPAEPTLVSLMEGAVVEGERLVLVRKVEAGGWIRKQGLVIDIPRLAQWLTGRALAGSPLERAATLRISTRPKVPTETEHGFTHRFGEPFEGIGASLALKTLPDAVDTGWVYGLGLGLLFMAPLGLIALYRMVAVTVRFAERQSDFVSAVTHELKTPLTSIRMYGEMLRDGVVPDPDKRQRYYTHITAEAERLSRLIGNVLELARLEKGNRPMNPTVGDPGDALRSVAELFGPQAAGAGFELVVEAEPGLPAVRFDRDALVQVLFNLVDNAVKYARDAEDRRVVLRAERDGAGVALLVRDHGPGVPARQLRQVFEPFFRGERELTRTATGTGIGLALVRGLVDRMGGAVTAENAADGGLRVRITLPVAG